MSGEPSLEDVRYALNVAGLSPRSHVYVDRNGIIVVKIQINLVINSGTQVPYGCASDIQDKLACLIDKITWKENSTENWQLAFSGNGIAITVSDAIPLPEGHDIHDSRHRPLIHQGNDEGRAIGVYRSASKRSSFSINSVLETFSWMPDKAIAELLRHGPGHEVVRINRKGVYEDLFPHLAQAYPWTDTFCLPYPLRDTRGWVSRPISQEG